MEEFKAFWMNYVNFRARTTRRGYWMAYLFYFIASVIIFAISSVIGGPQTTILQVESIYVGSGVGWDGIYVTTSILFSIWILVTIIPYLAIAVRRLRDAGKMWPWLFINFIPLIGVIIYIVLLCKRSVPDDGTPVV